MRPVAALAAPLLVLVAGCQAPVSAEPADAPAPSPPRDAHGLPAVGAPAPAWEAADHTGRRWSSDALRGERYLVWFYPMAMTPG